MKYANSQLRFVNGTELSCEQLTHVTRLIFDTGPYLESSKNNRLGLPEIEFQKQVSILPALSHLRTILDKENRVAGFYIAMTKQETIELYNQCDNYYEDTPDNTLVFNEISDLYVKTSKNHDLILHNGALRRNMRGFGMCNFLAYDILCLATQKKLNRIFGATWGKNTHAIKTFKHYSAQQNMVLDFRNTTFQDQLISLVCTTSALEDKLKTYNY